MMKLKKVLSLLISASMAVSAFAVLAHADEGDNISVTVEEYDASAALTEYKRLDKSATAVPEGYGVYKLTFDLSNLGAFELTANTDDDEYTGTMISAFSMELVGTDVKSIRKINSSCVLPVTAKTLAGSTGLQYAYLAGSPAAAAPKTDVSDSNYSIANAITATVYAPIGTELTLTGKYGIKTAAGTDWAGGDATFTQLQYTGTVKLGTKIIPPVEEKELGLTIDGTNAKKENGYIWKLNLTQKNGAQANSFVADFTDSKGDTNTKKARNNVADFFGGEGSVEFYVGLKTARTITEFKATVADSTAEGVTASDTWTAAE